MKSSILRVLSNREFKAIQDKTGCDLATAKEDLESELRSYIKIQLSNDPLYIIRTGIDTVDRRSAIKRELKELITDCAVRIDREELDDLPLIKIIKEILR